MKCTAWAFWALLAAAASLGGCACTSLWEESMTTPTPFGVIQSKKTQCFSFEAQEKPEQTEPEKAPAPEPDPPEMKDQTS